MINPLNSFVARNAKSLAYISTETLHNVIFHFIETVKVRGQARNLKSGDVSHYFKNSVEKKPLISGVIPGFFGAAIGASTFMGCYTAMTKHLYSGQSEYKGLDFRLKNFGIYFVSDFVASFTKILFETRKQLFMMATKDSSMKAILYASAIGWAPLMIRDVGFRSILLGFYYGTCDIEHKPMLMYTIPQISEFMADRRKKTGNNHETMADLGYLFYDFHNVEIKTKVTTRLTSLLCANAVATLVTNPFDVVLSKILTQ